MQATARRDLTRVVRPGGEPGEAGPRSQRPLVAREFPAIVLRGCRSELQYSAALGAALLFGASTPLAKALSGELTPALLAALLYLGSGLGLWTVRVIRDRGTLTATTPITSTPTPSPGMGASLTLTSTATSRSRIATRTTRTSITGILIKRGALATPGIAQALVRQKPRAPA